MTCTYVRYNNLKKTGQLRNVWVEFGFGTEFDDLPDLGFAFIKETASLKYSLLSENF